MYKHICLFLTLALVGCMEGSKPSPAQRSLYERMGGEKVIVKVVDDFVANVLADPDYKEVHKEHFKKGDVNVLKKKLVDQIGQATGGPQKYAGKGMKEAHQGLAITDQDFDALVADLVKALDTNKVGKPEQTELLTMLGGMRKEIVEAPAPKKE
ncbi:MAG: group 1 truncated hemoglobin [Gemmataceae bacterium]|nr:group 1 truncated hemoglobin [Gemmataceae bacterium]